ncbi:unnamed protein product [Discosporangium mesarthrocarpum]
MSSSRATGSRKSTRVRRSPGCEVSTGPSPKRMKGKGSKNVAQPVQQLPDPNGPTATQLSSKFSKHHFPGLPFYPTIEMDTGKPVENMPPWTSKQAPNDAAAGRNYVARMLGKLSLKILIQGSPSSREGTIRRLSEKHSIKFNKVLNRRHSPCARMWDEDGEFRSMEGEHIPVTRLIDALNNEDVGCQDVAPGLSGAQLLSHIYALQSPQSSPWKRPMMRALSTFSIVPGGLEVTYYVYAR